MSGNHKPFDRYAVAQGGAKAYTGGSLTLTKGQFGLFDVTKPGNDGAESVPNLKGYRKDQNILEVRFGTLIEEMSRSDNNKSGSTPPFAIHDIIGTFASYPQRSEQSVDDVILGYNGIDPKTAFKMRKGDRIPIEIELSDGLIGILGYDQGKVVLNDYISTENCSLLPPVCTECEPCDYVDPTPAILETIERIKQMPLQGDKVVADAIDVLPVIRPAGNAPTPPATTPMNFYCMSLCDTGDSNALASVQAQYPGVIVKRADRKGSISDYTIMTPGSKPADYVQTFGGWLKECTECPNGETDGGYVYVVTLDDEGADSASVVESLPNVVAGSAKKLDGQNGAVGTYTVILSKKLKTSEINTFVTTNPTATIMFIAETKVMCTNDATATYSWAACGSCETSTQQYTITLPDDECGNSMLPALQAAYPQFVITDYSAVPPAGCQRMFITTVPTNMRCAECDPIYLGTFSSIRPEPFMGREWNLVVPETTPDTGAMVGIRFRGKKVATYPDACYIDDISFMEDSTRIAVSGGYVKYEDVSENWTNWEAPLSVNYLSRFAPVTHQGGNMLDLERMGRVYFSGIPMHNNRMNRMMLQEDYSLDPRKQYADIGFTIQPKKFSNGMAQMVYNTLAFHILVPYGEHQGVVDFVNMLAAAAEVPPVAE